MTMYMMTPEQHAQIVDALSDERYVSQYSHIVEALAMLKAMQPVSPVNQMLLKALNCYMSAFGQFVESMQVEFSQQQKDADLQARAAIKLAEGATQ